MSTIAPSSMQVTREDLNPCTVKLTVVCSADQVTTGVRKAVKSLAKRIKVPGFRPGSAPINVLEQYLSPQDIDGLAQEETISWTYKKAIADQGIDQLGGQARLDDVVFDRAAGKCEYTVMVPLPPQVKLGSYQGLQVEKFKVSVSDEDIERQINEMRSRSGTKKAVQRGIQNGDNALVNIKPESTEGDGRNFLVVAGQTFPDLDKALEGMQAEDIKSATLKFPEGFQESDLAGKELKCTITVRSVSAIEVPELDDEFAKSMNLESVEDLRTRVRDYIAMAREQMAQEMVHERLLNLLLSTSEVHVADVAWEGLAERRLKEMEDDLKAKGSNLAQHAQANGMGEDEFKEALREEAKTQVQRAAVIERIFREEGMTVTDRDANEQFLRLAQENRVPEAELKRFAKQYALQIRDEIVQRTMYSKVMAKLSESAIVTEVEPPTR